MPFSEGKGGSIPLLSHLEVPGLQADAAQRSDSESTALSAESIKLDIVVQGWFRGGNGQGGLWKPWDKVTVWSPMLIMDNVTLICKSVTFTQDDRSGSRTTLELVNKLEGKPTV
jgi:prophage tail gpP-like protein